MTVLMWFRSDLRCYDNRALAAAADSSEPIVGIFCYTPKQWQAHDLGSNKVAFIHQHIMALQKELNSHGIPLLTPSCADYAGSVQCIVRYARRLRCSAVYTNVEYEINERQRDRDCTAALEQHSIDFFRHTDQTVLHPSAVQTGGGTCYKVFTPFKKSWIEQARGLDLQPVRLPKQRKPRVDIDTTLPQRLQSFSLQPEALQHWPIGEAAAQAMLSDFLERSARDYDRQRDLAAIDGTSGLSPYLSIGVLSPRQCLDLALRANNGSFDRTNSGISTWISELIWREFYRHVAFGFPHVCRGRAFKGKTEKLQWSDNDTHFQAWCDGRTGIPIVDAGMRQLRHCGWMHNRLRMICAMFLTKNLFIDWRRGETFFNQQLFDADFCSNNGGWQWSASTGTDAAPYFRIFNPYSQSKKCDPDGACIKQYVPELTDVPADIIHEPARWGAGVHQELHYPEPIVDCKTTRQQAIDAFKALT